MIPGIVATGFQTVNPGGQLVASATFDFVEGVFYWLGEPVAAYEVIADPELIDNTGLVIAPSPSVGTEIIHSGLATVLQTCNFTIVLEVYRAEATTSVSGYGITLTNSGGAFYLYLIANTGGFSAISFDGVDFQQADIFTGEALQDGIHKIAFTRTDEKMSLSVDGSTVDTDATATTLPVVGFPMTKLYLGGFDTNAGNDGITIRGFEIYDPVEDSFLPELSRWKPKGVQFNSALLELPAIINPEYDDTKFSMAGWFKTDWSDINGPYAWSMGNAVSPLTGIFLVYSNGFYVVFGGNSGDYYQGDYAPVSPIDTGEAWHFIMITVDGSISDGMVLWLDDVDITDDVQAHYSWSALPVNINNYTNKMWIGSDTTTDYWVGEMSDFSLWPGVQFPSGGGDTIDVSIRRAFIDSLGRPVPPSHAQYILGAKPALHVSGGEIGYLNNASGDSGALHQLEGSLTETTGPGG